MARPLPVWFSAIMFSEQQQFYVSGWSVSKTMSTVFVSMWISGGVEAIS
jgi:hypothetical protein